MQAEEWKKPNRERFIFSALSPRAAQGGSNLWIVQHLIGRCPLSVDLHYLSSIFDIDSRVFHRLGRTCRTT